MDNDEAIALLEQELADFCEQSYAELVRQIPHALHYSRTAPTGTKYQIEIQLFWDNRRGGNVRVVGSVDDAGGRAFVPVCRDFIKGPDGSFVGG